MCDTLYSQENNNSILQKNMFFFLGLFRHPVQIIIYFFSPFILLWLLFSFHHHRHFHYIPSGFIYYILCGYIEMKIFVLLIFFSTKIYIM